MKSKLSTNNVFNIWGTYISDRHTTHLRGMRESRFLCWHANGRLNELCPNFVINPHLIVFNIHRNYIIHQVGKPLGEIYLPQMLKTFFGHNYGYACY